MSTESETENWVVYKYKLKTFEQKQTKGKQKTAEYKLEIGMYALKKMGESLDPWGNS